MLRPVRRAFFSVSDKTGIVDLAQELFSTWGVELIATGGTKTTLQEARLPVRDVSELTGFPEILDGRVKTLHPAVFGGILAKRDKPEHLQTLQDHRLVEIDLIVCNLYPFEQTVQKPGVSEAEIIENIDIGGPAMIRAAAKNFAALAVLVSPTDYRLLLAELKTHQGQTAIEFRRRCAALAFSRIADYDRAIDNYFSGRSAAEDSFFRPTFELVQKLRQGENPHQLGMFYRDVPAPQRGCLATAQQLHGKELSFNNLLDLDAALNLAREFTFPAAVVVKHGNPCGAAVAKTLDRAFALAWEGDPKSAFGGILAFNQIVDEATARVLTGDDRFIECIIAPDYDSKALAILTQWKKNVRLLRTGELGGLTTDRDFRRVDGGLLVQTRDVGADDATKWKTVTQAPIQAEWQRWLWFAWIVCKHVKSNAIVLARGSADGTECELVGVGAGQMSRVDSTEIAIRKAGDRAKGSVLASDAFFPFADNVQTAAAAGIIAIVQPGGSQRDAESIQAANAAGIPMLFTGVRHFRH